MTFWNRHRTLFVKLIFIFSILAACDDEPVEKPDVRFSVSLAFTDRNPAVNIPVILNIGGLPTGSTFTPILQVTGKTDIGGHCDFEIPNADLPQANVLFYSFEVATDTLIITSGCNSFWPVIDNETNWVAFAVSHCSFVKVTFNKIDHNSLSFVRYAQCGHFLETTTEHPDTTFVQKVIFRYDLIPSTNTTPYSVNYLVGDGTGSWENAFHNTTLQMHDTTEVVIDY
jgi:hypothetical protein